MKENVFTLFFTILSFDLQLLTKVWGLERQIEEVEDYSLDTTSELVKLIYNTYTILHLACTKTCSYVITIRILSNSTSFGTKQMRQGRNKTIWGTRHIKQIVIATIE